jgi:hypothetical protein
MDLSRITGFVVLVESEEGANQFRQIFQSLDEAKNKVAAFVPKALDDPKATVSEWTEPAETASALQWRAHAIGVDSAKEVDFLITGVVWACGCDTCRSNQSGT